MPADFTCKEPRAQKIYTAWHQMLVETKMNDDAIAQAWSKLSGKNYDSQAVRIAHHHLHDSGRPAFIRFLATQPKEFLEILEACSGKIISDADKKKLPPLAAEFIASKSKGKARD